MTPEALRRRMAHGNIYPPERVDAALANYFRPGNLAALRELALLWVADRVDESLQQYMEDHGIDRPWETRERVVVALTGAPGGEALIRRAARMAAADHAASSSAPTSARPRARRPPRRRLAARRAAPAARVAGRRLPRGRRRRRRPRRWSSSPGPSTPPSSCSARAAGRAGPTWLRGSVDQRRHPPVRHDRRPRHLGRPRRRTGRSGARCPECRAGRSRRRRQRRRRGSSRWSACRC